MDFPVLGKLDFSTTDTVSFVWELTCLVWSNSNKHFSAGCDSTFVRWLSRSRVCKHITDVPLIGRVSWGKLICLISWSYYNSEQFSFSDLFKLPT